MKSLEYVDMHCHCHELDKHLIEKYVSSGFLIVCVSDDPSSSKYTTELYKTQTGIVPCLGIHPWEAHKYSKRDAEQLVEEAINNNIICLGEVGLDKKFYPHTYSKQLEIFNVFVKSAKEYDLVLNIHAAGAWRDVYELLIRNDIKRAFFHWYTGPRDLLDILVTSGYYIGANPAWKIQEKHKRILEYTPLENIITESDAPYNYRGLDMTPELVKETIEFVASIKKRHINTVKNQVLINANTLLHIKS